MGKGYVQNNNASKQAFAAMMFPILKKKFNERMSRYTGGKPFAGDKYDVVTHNLLAQLLTESGWGTEVTGDYNYYGIK
jgi:flagellum-specific peptidoglycan hydrolase FlgJ